MEQLALPMNGTGWVTPRGRLGIWVPDRAILVAVVAGHAHAAFATPVLEAYSRLSVHGLRYLFFDAESLESYDPEFRLRLTHQMKRDLGQIAELAVLVRSNLVRMGATVANLALGGRLTVHSNRGPFVQSVENVLRRSGVHGFSCNVLSTEKMDANLARP